MPAPTSGEFMSLDFCSQYQKGTVKTTTSPEYSSKKFLKASPFPARIDTINLLLLKLISVLFPDWQ